MDSGNSSTPPSREPLAAKARRKAARRASLRERSKERRPGHEGPAGAVGRADRTERADPPPQCPSSRGGPGRRRRGRPGLGLVWDIPPVRLEKVHWLLPKLRCGGCGKVTTADPPGGRPGTVVYGPNVNAAAVLLGSEGNVPVERTAMLMAALLGAPVSASSWPAHERPAERLDAAGFDAAMKAVPRRAGTMRR
jgi:transposase